MVRNHLECLGYDYVDDLNKADFWASVLYSNEYKSEYVPPSTSTVPWYVAGQTQTSHINMYGSSGYSWGTATTRTPGYYIPVTVTRPGYYSGAYYPYISVWIYDTTGSGEPIWTGNAMVSTPEKDIRLSCQALLPCLFTGKEAGNLPGSRNLGREDSKDGCFGIVPFVFTLEGNDFYPFIVGILCGSPGHKGGLKVYDMITEVDGESTLNWSWSRMMQAFDKDKGEELVLEVKRGEKRFEIFLVAEDEAVAKAEWHKVKCIDEKGNVVTKKRPSEG